MTDGGVADGIPVAETIRLGANRILVVRSRHYGNVKNDTVWHKMLRRKLREYDVLVKTSLERITRLRKQSR
jgi:predicted patatin/cPLA2 family phospholipase